MVVPPIFLEKNTKYLLLKLAYLKAKQKLGLSTEEEIKKVEEELRKSLYPPFPMF